MSVRVVCPGCGGPVVFEVGSSMVAVCPQCRSVVARGDRSVENLGKVAELVETGAALQVGTVGRADGVKFRLTGRTQLGHEAGGVWDEWYAAFADGRWGWLAEAQGRYYLLFEVPGAGDGLPEYTAIDPGRPLTVAGGRVHRRRGGAGHGGRGRGRDPLPPRPRPAVRLRRPVRPGRAVRHARLLAATAGGLRRPAGHSRRTGDPRRRPAGRRTNCARSPATKVSCPNCGGGLDLRAPDKTERVGCPYCGSLLDCERGELKLLKALKKPRVRAGPADRRGRQVRRRRADRDRRAVAERHLRRERYYWQEYLLYHPRDGFEWLVWSDNHWTRVWSVPPADVDAGATKAALRREVLPHLPERRGDRPGRRRRVLLEGGRRRDGRHERLRPPAGDAQPWRCRRSASRRK